MRLDRIARRGLRIMSNTKSAIHSRTYRAAHPERCKAAAERYRITHREEMRARCKADWAKNREERSAQKKVYRASHRDKVRAYSKAYYAAHREKGLANHKIYRVTHKHEIYIRGLKRKFGLSAAEYQTLLHNQGGVCAICKKVGWNGRKPHVDHDHETKKVRGILCYKCNTALGMIGDSPKIARAMADYIESHEEGR